MQSFIQSPAWEKFQQESGANILRHQDALYIERALPLNGSYFQTSRALFPSEFTPPPVSGSCWFIRVEPEDTPSFEKLQAYAQLHNLQLKSTIALQPRQTSLVDISPSYETILQNMKQKHRYNIRLAERHEVEVDQYSEQLEDSFERFWNLLNQTSQRHELRTHSKGYYQQMLASLQPEGMTHILIAHKDGVDLAGMILITYQGTATYLHGGSTMVQRELMAPYLLHAKAIQLAKTLNCTTYDLWGTHLHEKDGEWLPEDGHASAGTSRFKLGFNGTIINYPGTFDLILKPFWYTLYQTGRTLVTGKRDFA